MASKTKRTEKIRERKHNSTNPKRRAALRTKGTTKTDKELFGDK